MTGVPSIPRTGLPRMTGEGTQQKQDQLFYSSPFAPGSYIIRGGTFKNTTGGTLAIGVPEGLLVSYDPAANVYQPWLTGEDSSGETQAAAGVLQQGYGESMLSNATVLLTIILAARGGLRIAALKYNNSGVMDPITATQRDQFIADYIAAANVTSIGSASYSSELDPDGGGGVLFYG